MNQRLGNALVRAVPAGLVWCFGSSCLRWNREPHREAIGDGAILGLLAFALTFGLVYLFPSFPRKAPRRNSN